MSANQMNFTITPPKLKPKRAISLLVLILKTLFCVLGPLAIPTIIYFVEGSTTLFWCILGIASLTSFLLLTLDTQKVKDLTDYLKVNQCCGIRCLVKASLMILVCGGGTYAYHAHHYEIFNVCLFVAGLITGTFMSDFTAWWVLRRKKDPPYVNFTNSPKLARPSFLDLGRKTPNVSGYATDLLPLKRQPSAKKKSFSPLKCSKLDEMKPAPVSAETASVFMSPDLPGYPSLSSSSGDSDGPDVPQQPTLLTPTKRRVISAGLISLSPLANTPKTKAVSKRSLEYSRPVNTSPLQRSDNSHLQTIPTFTYTECNVETILSQNFSFVHM